MRFISRRLPRSFRFQMIFSVFGIFLILSLSTLYILLTVKNLQTMLDNTFKQERFISSLREDLARYQEPLLDYLSTRSSNALGQILIESQTLRNKLPAYSPITIRGVELRERELYSLIRSYLNLAGQAMEEKRGRNIAAYTAIYEEMSRLLSYINREIEDISAERFRNQMDVYGFFIARTGTIQFWNLLFIVFVSILAILLLLSAAGRITGPLVRLSAMASELAAGRFDAEDIAPGSVEEMNRVVEAFNRMKREIRNYIEEIHWQEHIKQEYMRERMRNMKMEGLVRRMEIYALQAQMNPHFLFNTLNTGMQLAIVEGADRTGEYMEYMAKLFRHIIRNKEIIVPLRHEIEGLEFYFYLLKVRFPRNLDLSLDYDAALLDRYRTPVSILQPLVENCIVHAFKGRDGSSGDSRSLIAVKVETCEERLILSVWDNGRGMERKTMEKLLHPHSLDESSLSRVMGLENVIQRLYFFYPDDPEVVSIESNGEAGTAVIIRIDTKREPCLAF